MSDSEKKSVAVKVWLSERQFNQVAHEAALDDRKLSEFIGVCLDRYLNGSKRQREMETGE